MKHAALQQVRTTLLASHQYELKWLLCRNRKMTLGCWASGVSRTMATNVMSPPKAPESFYDFTVKVQGVRDGSLARAGLNCLCKFGANSIAIAGY